MPGFGGGDQTLLVMATWLRRLGYCPRLVGFVTNSDCSDRALDRVERTVDELWRPHGRRVALIGHSRGGHFARALAACRPDRISHAISAGADLQGMFGASRPTLHAVLSPGVLPVLLRVFRGRCQRGCWIGAPSFDLGDAVSAPGRMLRSRMENALQSD